jgi:hypothetical protein
MKESEQAELSKAVIEKVLATIKDEKTQRDILASAVAEVERQSTFYSFMTNANFVYLLLRTCQEQSHLTP